MSISVTTDKFVAWYMEFGTFYGFFKFGFINSQNIKWKLSKKDSKFVKCLKRPLMFKQAILKPRLAGKKLGILERHKLSERASWALVAIWCGRAYIRSRDWQDLSNWEVNKFCLLWEHGTTLRQKRNEQEVNPAMYSKNITLSPLISRQLYCLRNCKICSGLKSERIYINESYTTCSLSTFFAFFSIKSLLTLAFVLVSVFRWYAAAPITGVVLARIACGKNGYFTMK